MGRFYFALLALMLVLAAQPLVAATYYVGTCKVGAFGSISAAVASATVPPGSIIDVCPGTYPEQIVINKALTIQGIFNTNSSQAVIAMPSGGLGTTSSINSVLGTIAAQVEVTAGPVNITNITVDGTAGTTSCPSTDYVGIFYSSGSSGTVNEVETRNQTCNSGGVGITAENGAAASPLSVTIENSNIHDNSFVGIITCSNQPTSTLTASIKGNYIMGGQYGVITFCNAGGSVSSNTIAAGNNGIGIYAGSSSTTLSGNTVIDGAYGIFVVEAAVVSGNTVTNASFGIVVEATGSVTSNHISNSAYGISLIASGATIKSNAITKASTAGIEFNCNTDTVSGNTINGAPTGLDRVPAAFSGVNKFNNVATVRTDGC